MAEESASWVSSSAELVYVQLRDFHSLPRIWNMVVPFVVSAVASFASVNEVYLWLLRCFLKSSFLLSKFSQVVTATAVVN